MSNYNDKSVTKKLSSSTDHSYDKTTVQTDNNFNFCNLELTIRDQRSQKIPYSGISLNSITIDYFRIITIEN